MRGRLWPSIGSLVFFIAAPGTVAGLLPCLISGWRVGPPPLAWPGLRVVGGLVIVAGVTVLVECFVRFALQGRGTPAPVLQTERLVVTGWYRFVRNPMYVAVVAVILGQVLLLGNMRLLIYGAAVALGFHLFVLLYEEPTLRRRYGEEYEAYCSGVGRWWPRSTPWAVAPENGAAEGREITESSQREARGP